MQVSWAAWSLKSSAAVSSTSSLLTTGRAFSTGTALPIPIPSDVPAPSNVINLLFSQTIFDNLQNCRQRLLFIGAVADQFNLLTAFYAGAQDPPVSYTHLAVIALESRLSEIRYQLESFESQLRLYDNQVDYSTVELHISEVQSLTPTAPDNLGTRISKGFDRSLSRLADNTISLFVWVVSNSPYLILLAAAWMIVRRFLQNNRSGREHRGGWFGRKFNCLLYTSRCV